MVQKRLSIQCNESCSLLTPPVASCKLVGHEGFASLGRARDSCQSCTKSLLQTQKSKLHHDGKRTLQHSKILPLAIIGPKLFFHPLGNGSNVPAIFAAARPCEDTCPVRMLT